MFEALAGNNAFVRRILVGVVFFGVALTASPLEAATLRLSPATLSARVGESVTLTVYVSSTDQAMNAASGSILFPNEFLEVRSVSKASSVLSYWTTEPTFSNGNGSVSFEGVAFNPGYTGSSGRIMSVTLRAIAPGSAELSFASPSILANDGLATNILSGTTGARITIQGSAPVEDTPDPTPSRVAGKAVRISSPTHPNPDTWYAAEKGSFAWVNPEDTTAIRLLYDQRPNAQPSVVYSPAISSKEIDLIEGVGYVHVQVRTPDGWNETAHYTVRMDATPPSPVRVSYPMGTTTATRLLAIIFESTDALSGIDHYDITLDGKVVATATADEAGKPFFVPVRASGSLAVIAVDRAGNSATSASESVQTTRSLSLLSIESLIAFLLALLIILAGANLYFMLFKRRRSTRPRKNHLRVHALFDTLKDLVADAMSDLDEVHSHHELAVQKERIINRLKRLVDKYEASIEKELDQ